MKKAILLILAAALTLGAFQNSLAAGRTSTQLATNTNLTNDITRPDPESVPIGTVIAWPYSALPADGNWLECNGQTVSTTFTDFRSKFGTTVPDYRGYFLRGNGGKSAALGVTQQDAGRLVSGDIAIQTQWESNGVKIVDTYNKKSVMSRMSPNTSAGDHKNEGRANRWTYLDSSNEWGAAHTTSGANAEFRPLNKAVKYIIKVR